MRSILDWLSTLLWETRLVGDRALSDVAILTARILVGPAYPLKPDEDADLILRADDGHRACDLLNHLARLGTVDRVLVRSPPGLPLSQRRKLDREARRQRQHGLRVDVTGG